MSSRTSRKTATRSSTVRAKKSFTLSPSSVAFLEKLRKHRKASSTSAVLDQLLRETEERQRQETYEKAMLAYYDNRSDEERKEEQLWGEFAFSRMRGEWFE